METIIKKFEEDLDAFTPGQRNWSRSWCGQDCSQCGYFYCKMLRGQATPALDALARKRIFEGGDVATLDIPLAAKKFVLAMVKAATKYTELTRSEEAILKGVSTRTLQRRKS